MKFTYNWLKRFLDTQETPEIIAEELTNIGLELEETVNWQDDLSDFIVAEVQEAEPHPNADKLKICKVFDSKENLQIVCGANNVRAGIKVVLAKVGTLIPDGEFKIKKSKIRDIESNGMICSAGELLIPGAIDNGGIIELDKNAIAGESPLKYLGVDDVMFDVAVTPNRGDWLGVYGIARDLAARGLGKLIPLEDVRLDEKFTSNFKAEINSPDCSKLSFREIRNVKNIESPDWLKDYFNLIGMSPISFIVDVTNYFSISFGRPMHAYDSSKLAGNIISANYFEGEYEFAALNDKTYNLSSKNSINDLVISDAQKPVAIAGVVGGENSCYDENSQNILLESAAFSKVKVAEMGRKYGIITDSRSRFERGVDDERSTYFLDLAVRMISEYAGGEVSNLIHCENNPSQPREIDFEYKILNKRIGISKTNDEMEKILLSLGFEIISKDNNSIKLKIPAWRHDINCPEVIAEEIARINGYEKIELKSLNVENNLSRLQELKYKTRESLSRITASLGYKECITYSFMNSKIAKFFHEIDDQMRLVNPITSDFDYMRSTIIPNLLLAAKNNIARSQTNIAIFEQGPIFTSLEKDGEENLLAAINLGNIFDKSHSNEEMKMDLYNVKSDLENLIIDTGFDPSKLQIVSDKAPSYYHPGRSGAYMLGKNKIAYFGEIHPGILQKIDISQRVFAFELFVDRLPKARQKFGRKSDIELSQYQKVSRDFAFLVPRELEAQSILSTLAKLDSLIIDVDIFDSYIGEKIEDTKKSLAVRVSFQSMEKTLQDKDIEDVSNKIISTMKDKFDSSLRN